MSFRIYPPVIGTSVGGVTGGGGGSSTKQVTLSGVPTIFRHVVLQPGKDHYDVTTTWRDLRTGRTESLNTGTVIELGPVQIGNLADHVGIFGTGIVYCGSHTSPNGIGVEQKYQYAKADTETGTYSTYDNISASTYANITGSEGMIFRSKIAAGGAGGRAFADYMPATQVASTWEDMGFVATDVGKWIKFIVLHKKPSGDHPDIEQRYGWRLTLKVDSKVDRTVAVTFDSGGSDFFLGPDEEPDEDDWIARKGKWTGREVAPIDRDLIGGHGAVARFATINNDSATTGFGYEQLTRTSIYANMTAAIDLDTHIYWEWAAGQAVKAGDFIYRLSGGTEEYSICLRDHTTTAGNVADGAPNETNQTGWVTRSVAQVVNHADFVGIVGRLNAVDTSTLSHGDWVVSIVNDFMSLWIWSSTHSDWLDYFPASIGILHESGYLDNDAAANEVREFNSSAPDYYLIDGKLKILLFYIAPTAGAAVYFTHPINRRDPVAYYWGAAQTERVPETFPVMYPGVLSTIFKLNFADATNGPHESFDGGADLGNIFKAVADVSSDIDVATIATDNCVFSLPIGRYNLEFFLEHNDSSSGRVVISLLKIITGTDDIIVRGISAYSQNTSLALEAVSLTW